jgi:hypothetical protein
MVKATASYNMVPIVATGTFWPASTLAAPHTICTGTPSPKSTVVILACRHQDEEHK